MQQAKEQEIRLEHRLELRRIIIDRIGIGLLIALAVFFSDSLLEKIKQDSTKEMFVLEKKLEAITMTQEVHSKITTYLYSAIGTECTNPGRKIISTEQLQEYLALDTEFRNTANSRIYLLSKDYQSSINQVHNVVAGIASIVANQPDPDCKLRVFLNDVAQSLEVSTREELELDVMGFSNGFKPLDRTAAEIEQIGLSQYLSLNFEAWQSAQGAI